MANFCSGVKVRLFGGAAGSMSSSVTSSFWARSIKGVELVKVMVSVLPVSPWREERLRQVSHVSLTDRVSSLKVSRWPEIGSLVTVEVGFAVNRTVRVDPVPVTVPPGHRGSVGSPPGSVDRTVQVIQTDLNVMRWLPVRQR